MYKNLLLSVLFCVGFLSLHAQGDCEPACGEEVPNGSFENGDCAWIQAWFGSLPLSTLYGNSFPRIFVQNNGFSGNHAIMTTVPITLIPGVEYIIEYDYGTYQPSSNKIDALVIALTDETNIPFDPLGNVLNVSQIPIHTLPSPAETSSSFDDLYPALHVEGCFTAPTDGSFNRLFVYGAKSTQSGTNYVAIDNISIRPKNPAGCNGYSAAFSSIGNPGTSLGICSGQDLSFLMNNPVPPDPLINYTYTWTIDDGTNIIDILVTDVAATIYSYTFNNAGIYTVTLKLENCLGCEDEYSITVEVDDDEVCDISCPSVVCEGDTEEYTALCDCPEYNWDFLVDGVSLGQPTGQTVSITWGGLPANHSGYGLIVLNTPNCPGHGCETTLVDISIISQDLEIVGPELICSGTNEIQYSVPMWPGANYDWTVTPTDGGDPISWDDSYNSISVNLAPDFDRTFTVSVVVSHNFLDCETTASLDVVSNATTIDGKDVYCLGDPIELTLISAQPGLTYEMTINGPGGPYVCTGNSNMTCSPNLGVGEYVASLGIQVGGQFINCTYSSFPFKVTENPPIEDSEILGDRTICAGTPYTYSIDPYDPETDVYWLFEGADIPFGSGESVTVVWLADAAPYSIEVIRVVEGCDDQTKVIEITAEDPPLLEVVGNQTVCADSEHGYTLELAGVLFNNADYINWTTDNGAGSVIAGQGTNSPTIQWHQIGAATSFVETLRVEVLTCGFTEEYTLEVTITSEPDIEISAELEACENELVSFSTDVVAATYEWTLPNGDVFGNSSNASHTFTSPGNYNIKLVVTGVANCPGTFVAYHNINILPNPEPIITFTGNLEHPDCEEDPTYTTLISLFTQFNSSYTYQWKKNGIDIPGATNSQLDVNIDNAAADPGYGIYTVEVTLGSCSNTSGNFFIICEPPPPPGCPAPVDINIDWSLGNSCGDVVVVGAPTPFSPMIYDYFWVMQPYGTDVTLTTAAGTSITASGFQFPILTASDLDITLSFEDPGFYNLSLLVVEIGGEECTAGLTVQLEVPVVADYRYEVVDCAPGNEGASTFSFIDMSEGILIDPPSNAPVSWTPQWLVTGPGVADQSGTGSLFEADLVPGITYTITMDANTTYNNNGTIVPNYACSGPTMQITIPDITAEFTVAAPDYCAGTALTFEPLVNDADVQSYHWDFGHPSNATSGIRNPSFTYSESGTYTVTLTITNEYGCEISEMQEVIINDDPKGEIIEEFQCDQASLCFVSDENITAYEWSNGETSSCISTTLAGNYRVTVTNDLGCTSIYTTTLSSFPPIQYTISGPTELCIPTSGTTVTFSTFGNPDATYSWQSVPDLTDLAPEGELFTVNITSPGSYTISLTVMQDGEECGAENLVLEVNEIPVLDFEITTACDPYLATISELNGYQVEWSFNGQIINPSSAVLNTTIPGIYEVTYSQDNCSVTQSVYVPSGDVDFSTLLTGCYDVCPSELTPEDCIPGLMGSYDSWEWKYLSGGVLTSFAPPESGAGDVQELCLTEDMFTGINFLEIVLEAESEAGCLQVSDPISFKATDCDSTCLEAVVTNIQCHNGGTADPSDDHWTFDLTVTGGLPGSYWITQGLNPNEAGPYGNPPNTFWMGGINGMGGTVVTFDVMDFMDNSCRTTVSVVIPEECSDCECESISDVNVSYPTCISNPYCVDVSFNYSGADGVIIDFYVDQLNSTPGFTLLSYTSTTTGDHSLVNGLNEFVVCFEYTGDCIEDIHLFFDAVVCDGLGNDNCKIWEMLMGLYCCGPKGGDRDQVFEPGDRLHQGALQLEVSPNPTSGLLNIKLQNPLEIDQSQLKLYDVYGRIVHTQTYLLKQGANNFNLDISDFSSGTYILQLQSQTGITTTTKIVKL